jgi:ubiquitin C-terminal hydrolase
MNYPKNSYSPNNFKQLKPINHTNKDEKLNLMNYITNNYPNNNYMSIPSEKSQQNKYQVTTKENKEEGIINYGNNCYLNSGLQILASCNQLVKELEKYMDIKNGLIGLMNNAFIKILSKDIYDPIDLWSYFCYKNNELLEAQYCSQDFIRKILKNLNDELIAIGDIYFINEIEIYKPECQIEEQKYINYINSNNDFPESKAFKLFTGINKFHSTGICQHCQMKNEDFSFSYFIDQNIYLDEINEKSYFSKVLFENIGKMNYLSMNCKQCKQEIIIKEDIKFIKLPEILIFTLERYNEKMNNIEIIPDEIINMNNYLDNSVHLTNTKYELFAINIRFGSSRDNGHEMCQVKRNGQWYEINDIKIYKKTRDYNSNSYGLFYRRL